MVSIPGEPTLPEYARSVNMNTSDGPRDVWRYNPWRAPGSAPVFGSGCGSAGGGALPYQNGGNPPPGIPLGFDGAMMPPTVPVVWARGTEVAVAFALEANHGGGYSYRLCPAWERTTEECFQRTPLRFGSDKTSWLVYANGSKIEFPRVQVDEGTTPAGSEWARNPVPTCALCDPHSTCGPPLKPERCDNFTTGGCPQGSIRATCGDACFPGDTFAAGCPGPQYRCHGVPPPGSFAEQQQCYANCAGSFDGKIRPTEALNDRGPLPGGCPAGTAAFPEPAPHVSGFNDGGVHDWDWSVMDLVKVPPELRPGRYVLSWRWDGEQSAQIWQNCADLQVM
eukprot:TRINITY_DN2290_c0_g1_i1.p1 TRINITY_DN2290_c0_g1~~TRINITY_DN2290_c0_g1_i1.p1  ORF type:complete len:337 (+),score=48.54 TRINITY_DN2290_c0_g1_i1:293-1303(+)